MIVMVIFSPISSFEAIGIPLTQGETQHVRGILRNQRVPHLSFRELQIKMNTAAGFSCLCFVGFRFHRTDCQVLQAGVKGRGGFKFQGVNSLYQFSL